MNRKSFLLIQLLLLQIEANACEDQVASQYMYTKKATFSLYILVMFL